jgi:hypothetical protein
MIQELYDYIRESAFYAERETGGRYGDEMPRSHSRQLGA